MITAQEIREKVFEKAVFGGYDMTQVDEFMAELANDLELVRKENATLTAKMKILAAKVAEYRDNEEALRMAMVSAQKMSASIEGEAREKSETILSEARTKADALVADAEARAAQLVSEAEAKADALTGDAKRFLAGEDARLEEAKRESAKFIENMNLLCRRQLSFLEKVGEMDFMQEARARREAEEEETGEETPEEAAGELHETVRSIEETVAKAAGETAGGVFPEIDPAPAEDEMPTRPFNPVGDAGEKSFQLSLDEVTE